MTFPSISIYSGIIVDADAREMHSKYHHRDQKDEREAPASHVLRSVSTAQSPPPNAASVHSTATAVGSGKPSATSR